MAEQFTLDFGDPTLNDPDYEQKVQDDGTLTDTPTDSTSQQSSNDTVTQEPQQVDQSTGNEVGESSTVDGTGQQQSGEPAKPAPADDKGQQQQARMKSDKDGNLVDADGNIVAKAGAERRQYERVQAQASYIQQLETEMRQFRERDAMAGVLNDAPTKLGLNMQETEMGLQAIASFKKDPVATARWMLQETLRLGYNLNQIVGEDAQGQLNSGSLDLQAVKSMINEAVSPMLQDRNAQQQQEQTLAAAKREYDAFIAKYEHASVHEDVLATMLQEDASLTPQEAYWQLREFAAKHQFDFSKPLRDQAVSRQQRAPQQQNGNATPKAQSTMPMPNGGAPVSNAAPQSAFADPDDAWDSIVADSLREAGM